MKILNFYNASISVRITPNYLGVIIYAFSDDGFMHKFANRFNLTPELAIKTNRSCLMPPNFIPGKNPNSSFRWTKSLPISGTWWTKPRLSNRCTRWLTI